MYFPIVASNTIMGARHYKCMYVCLVLTGYLDCHSGEVGQHQQGVAEEELCQQGTLFSVRIVFDSMCS